MAKKNVINLKSYSQTKKKENIKGSRKSATEQFMIFVISIILLSSCSVLKIESQEDFEKFIKMKASAHKKIIFNAGAYSLVREEISLFSNMEYIFEDSSYIFLKHDAIILSKHQNNIKVEGLHLIVDTNHYGGKTGAIQFIDCDNLQLDEIRIKSSKTSGLVLDNCSNSKISKSRFTHNYYYGVYDRKGTNNVYSKCTFQNNGGNNGKNPYKGRGMVVWEGQKITILESSFKFNNEYGLRIYSQKEDKIDNRFLTIKNCLFQDNGSNNRFVKEAIDLYLYDGENRINNVNISNNTFVRKKNFGKSVNIMGQYITLKNNIFQGNDNSTGVFVYSGSYIKVQNNEFFRLKTAVQNGSKKLTNCEIEDNKLIQCSSKPFVGDKLSKRRNLIIER